MKRKDYGDVTNRIVSTEQVLARGLRAPAIELTFKTSGHNRTGGHRVYIDYKCAQELITKLQKEIDSIESKYFVNEYYNRLHRPLETLPS